MAKVLVVGGAGYVGSTTCAWLLDAGMEVWVLDQFSTGHRELLQCSHFVYGAAGNEALVRDLLLKEKFDCVFHFAAKCLVSESVEKPDDYYENNVAQTERLLKAMQAAGTRRFVFSSTCAIFGNPEHTPISETAQRRPLSPYGQTKLEAEKLLQEGATEWGLQAIALRYFNAAGAEPKGRTGELHDCETHLIPKIFEAALGDKPVEVFGTDYPTPDGTCVRDYIHVWDLAGAHGAAMQKLLKMDSQAGAFFGYNLGSEKGNSVLEVIRSAERVIGKNLKTLTRQRREGDPPKLVADSNLARTELGFQPQFGLDEILASAWAWEKKKASLFRPVVFLDRDGTLNEDPGYLNDPSQLKLLPHVGEALALLKAKGYKLVVVSNQSGIARGLVTAQSLKAIEAKLQDLLKPWAVCIDEFSSCTHHPDEHCACRKPKPKMLIELAARFRFDLKRSFMVGDKVSDLQAGASAGVKGSLLVKTGDGSKTATHAEAAIAAYSGETLLDIANWIISCTEE